MNCERNYIWYITAHVTWHSFFTEGNATLCAFITMHVFMACRSDTNWNSIANVLRLIKNTQSPSTQKTHTRRKEVGEKSTGTLDKKVWNPPLISAKTNCRNKVQISQYQKAISTRKWPQWRSLHFHFYFSFVPPDLNDLRRKTTSVWNGKRGRKRRRIELQSERNHWSPK